MSNFLKELNSFIKKTNKISNEEDSGNSVVVPTGLDVLDLILGGGLRPKLCQFVGMPGCGKSSLVTQILGNAQKIWGEKFLYIYFDTENAMTVDRMKQLGVLYPEEPYNKNLTIEKVFEVIESLCAFKEQNEELSDLPAFVIWDSIANTIPEKALSETNPASILGLKALLFSNNLPRIVELLDKNKITLICINQLRDKIEIGPMRSESMHKFLPNKNIPGGYSLNFNTSLLLKLTVKENVKEDSTLGFVGNIVSIKAIKNRYFSPNVEMELAFDFVRGFDNDITNFLFLKKEGILETLAGWIKLPGLNKKYRTREYLEKIKTDPELQEVVKNLLNGLFDSYKEKYGLKGNNLTTNFSNEENYSEEDIDTPEE